MSKVTTIPLKELSIHELFIAEEKCTYEIPVYQRNYAWERDEISALIHDVDDSFHKDPSKIYYIGTLVTYDKKDRVFEVIDGQQRLTTLYIILKALKQEGIVNKLSYRARKKSDNTLSHLEKLNRDYENDSGIENGYKYVTEELEGITGEAFKNFFLHNVHIVRYMVPRDIDLNHYFEIMNSRGEQLEKHEIVKAQLMQKLPNDEDRHIFHLVWESCSEMNMYVQQRMPKASKIFKDDLYHFIPNNYQDLKDALISADEADNSFDQTISIADILSRKRHLWDSFEDESTTIDTFQPIIDFPNFLLIVLKLVRLSDPDFLPESFNLDDKELINEFNSANMGAKQIKRFIFTLLKTRYFLDNYIVHHSKEEDTIDSNPWKLQVWHKDSKASPTKEMLKNLVDDIKLQDILVHLLSMFEVSFTARQRKNYLLYCLMYLMNCDIDSFDPEAYAGFLEDMADRYFRGVYLDSEKLSEVNKPTPGSFDEVMIANGVLNHSDLAKRDEACFIDIYGDGTEATRGIPLFVFNYADYRIWKHYSNTVRGKELKEGSRERNEFFDSIGCSDFGLKIFDLFYFSRTRRSLEHYYPQNQATGVDGRLNQAQINCFGNFAMIGSEANSSGSDWSPLTKLDHYLDSSKKIRQVSVASLKFMIMMQTCKDHQKWDFEDIRSHQKKVLALLI